MARTGIDGKQISDDSVTGDDIDESTLVLKYFLNAKYTANSTSELVYIKWRTMGSNTSPGVNSKFVVPANGTLKSILLRSTHTPGSTEVSLHKASDGTENLSTSPVETQTVDLSTDDTVVKATFSDSATFSAHDIIGISVNPTDNHGNVDLTIIFELEPF